VQERHMAQQQPPQGRTGAVRSGRGISQSIEKGWTVYDAVQRPIGNVTDVDTARDVLIVDGRPTGFNTFEIPLSFVRNTRENEIHLTKTLESTEPSRGGTPRFVDPSTETSPSPSRSRSRVRTEAGATMPAAEAGATSARAESDVT